jgi:hypothetical protein
MAQTSPQFGLWESEPEDVFTPLYMFLQGWANILHQAHSLGVTRKMVCWCPLGQHPPSSALLGLTQDGLFLPGVPTYFPNENEWALLMGRCYKSVQYACAQAHPNPLPCKRRCLIRLTWLYLHPITRQR